MVEKRPAWRGLSTTGIHLKRLENNLFIHHMKCKKHDSLRGLSSLRCILHTLISSCFSAAPLHNMLGFFHCLKKRQYLATSFASSSRPRMYPMYDPPLFHFFLITSKKTFNPVIHILKLLYETEVSRHLPSSSFMFLCLSWLLLIISCYLLKSSLFIPTRWDRRPRFTTDVLVVMEIRTRL